MSISQAKIGRGALWSVINSGLAQVLALVIFFVTARFVSAEDFGIMAICLLIVELFKQVAIESFATTITASHDPTDDDYNTCFVAILVASVGSAVATFIAAGWVAAWMRNPHIEFALQSVSLLLLTVGLQERTRHRCPASCNSRRSRSGRSSQSFSEAVLVSRLPFGAMV